MRIPILTSLALPLAACAGNAEPAETPPDRMRQLTGGMCDADAVQNYLGRQANDEIGEEIVEKSGATILRWGPPYSNWTMDYRSNRVNVRYDAAMTITEITCG
jgi:hypothetical protein